MLPVGSKPVFNTGTLIWDGDFAEVFRFSREYASISEKQELRGLLVAGESITQSEKQGHEQQSAYLAPASPTPPSTNTIRCHPHHSHRNLLLCHQRPEPFQLDSRNEAVNFSLSSGEASSGSLFWRTSSILEAKTPLGRRSNRPLPSRHQQRPHRRPQRR